MGASTLTKMVNSVFARTDENAASDNAVNSKVRPEVIRAVESLNMGYRTVFKKLYGSLRPQVLDAITTVPGHPSYEVSPLTDVLQTMYVYPLGVPGSLVPQSNVLELTTKFGVLNTQGDPQYWYRYEGTLSFYPVPSSTQVYVVEGSTVFKELSAASDTSFLPEEHDYMLQAFAIAVEKAFWKDPDARLWMDKFESDLIDLDAEALRNAPTKIYAVDVYAQGDEFPVANLPRYYT